MSKIEPCPFCGSEHVDALGWASTESAGPACDDCGASAGSVKNTPEQNLDAWNKRSPQPAGERVKGLEQLSAAIQRLIGRGNALLGYCETPEALEAGAAQAYAKWKREADASMALALSALEPQQEEPVATPAEVTARYWNMLHPDVEAICEPDPGTAPHHLKWMLQELRTMTDYGKAMRWLGFIQGTMIAAGYTTVQAERDFTRLYFAAHPTTQQPVESDHIADAGKMVVSEDLVERLRPNAVVDHVPGLVVSQLRMRDTPTDRQLADRLNAWVVRNNDLKSEAIAALVKP